MQTDATKVPTFADVAAAADRISSRLVRTPVMSSPAMDKRVDRRVVFKCENLQHGGAFKYRGALNAILPLAIKGDVSAVATHSSGNHGTAVALAAKICGLDAYIVVPRDSARRVRAPVNTECATARLKHASSGAPKPRRQRVLGQI